VISFPWYLFAAGIFIVIIGALLSGVMKPPGSRGRAIDPRMRDDEIVRSLKRKQRPFLPNLVVLFGLLCILVSVIWRLVLLVVPAARS
jgi:hypothetical protein